MVATLKFNKTLLSTVDRPIPTKTLLVLVQQLSEELSQLEQDNIDLDSLATIKNELANKKLLKHANAGVQIYACCCVAEVLRLYAPDAPYTATELALIFNSFFTQFKHLADLENPYFTQQVYLVKLLAEVKCMVLITDLPYNEKLIESLFNIAYDLTKSNLPESLHPLIADILSEIISESESIPSDVLKLILNMFLHQNSTLTTKNISNPALQFSISICESNVDRMSRQVAKLFSEMIYETDSDSTSIEVLDKLRKIHKLIVQIWNYVPEMLISIMGLIDDELKVEDESIRILATETVGKIIGSTNSKVNFMITHKETWLNWLRKAMDISPAVRCKWVEQIPIVISDACIISPEYLSTILNGYVKCLLDTDEKVRFTACKSIDKIDTKVFLQKLCTKEILNTLLQLIREKNPEIRNEVLKILANLYNEFLNSDQQVAISNDVEENSKIVEIIQSEIPNNILSLIYINDKQITSSVDITLFEVLLPMETTTVKRVERLCRFYQVLSEKSKNSFIAITKRQQQFANVVSKFLDLQNLDDKDKATDSHNQKNLETKLEKILKWFCVSFPEGFNTFACFDRFYRLKNIRYLYLLKSIILSDSDYTTVKNSIKELLTKLGVAKNIKLPDDKFTISTADMVYNFKLLLYRSGMILYNRSNISELINHFKDKSSQWNQVANEILENISVVVPDVFKYEIEGITNLIINGEDEKSNILKILFNLLKKFPQLVPTDRNFTSKLKQLAITGGLNESKYAVKLLGLTSKKELYAEYLFDTVYPLNVEDDNFLNHLNVIAELYLIDPPIVEEKAGEITTILIKEFLLKNRLQVDDTDDWITLNDYKSHPLLVEKLLTLRIFVNRIKSFNFSQTLSSEQESVVQSVLKLLFLLIGNGGDIVNGGFKTPKAYQISLRYYAGLMLLKLAKIHKFDDYIVYPSFNRLIFLVQDENHNVRIGFMKKLEKYLSNAEISDKFIPLIYFVAYDPDQEIKIRTGTWIQSMHKRYASKQNIKFETSLSRLIHTIAHTQEFTELMENANKQKNKTKTEILIKAYVFAIDFIVFLVKNVANAENVSLLYYFASRIKQYRDALVDSRIYQKSPNSPSVLNLYCVAELAQLIIKELCDEKGWSMQSWPGKVKLCSELFAPMHSTQEAQSIITKIFITDDVQVAVKNMIKFKLSGTKKRVKAVQSKKITKKPKLNKQPASKNEPVRRSARLKSKVSYAVDDGSEQSSQEDEEDEHNSDYDDDN